MAHASAYAKLLIAQRDPGAQAAWRHRRQAGIATAEAATATERAAPAVFAHCHPPFFGCQPLQMLFGDFIEETRAHGVACLAMQHPALCQCEVQPFART